MRIEIPKQQNKSLRKPAYDKNRDLDSRGKEKFQQGAKIQG
jgi:hypothetical protein